MSPGLDYFCNEVGLHIELPLLPGLACLAGIEPALPGLKLAPRGLPERSSTTGIKAFSSSHL